METVFLELVKLSLIGSLFAAAVMLVRLIFPKTPKWILCLMWGVVALRLICPVSIESKLSLVPENIASGQIITSVGNEYIGDVEIIRENDTGYRDAVDAGRQPVSADDGYYVVTEKDSLEAPKTVAGTLYPILSLGWVVGVAAMLGYTAISYLMLRRKMAEATLLRENIWQCEQVDSPFVLGVIRPKIYLPYAITDSDMVNVIAHEQAHIHRKDHWWKPIGFILLSIYWFNPILWVAYIMLCRDIEAACDEKVIKHMEKDEMRAYSTALLNCSVNRRRIAACPLAFGEVGVKERVKTVMNYKKPAFWIVIAAVALCIVVAVCFLTDPKDYGPEVGNPKMLELPGVEWFVTPEEFKEALNITEDQIVNEGITLEREDVANDYDRYDLYVTDLTLYGRDVSYALFQFRRDPGYDFAFNQAIVMFAEDTDMVKFRDELEEIYGAGSRDPYRFYLYSNNEKQYHNTELLLEQNLKYYSQNDRFLEGLDGNPYQDALNDPDYMVHHWATENGCSVIPAEVVEWFKDAMEQPWNANNSVLQDDEVLMEMLDQMPWVSMTISNRCMPAIRQDAEGIEDESAALYTNNYIEFNANFLASYLYEARKAAVDDPSLLELPGVKWFATPDEVKAALNITEDQIVFEHKTSGFVLEMRVTDLTLYGRDIPFATFSFWFNNNGDTALRRATVFFSEDTNMNRLKQELIHIYGPGKSEPYSYSLYDNNTDRNGRFGLRVPSLEMSAEYEDGRNVFEGNPFRDALEDPDYMTHHWVTENGTSFIPEEVVEYFRSAEDEEMPQDEDAFMEKLDQMPWVVISMANRHAGDIANEITGNTEGYNHRYTNNYITFSADLLAEYLYTAQEAKVADAPTATKPNLLEFPGVKWGMTPEEVKSALNITQQQILRDEQYAYPPDAGNTDERWDLYVKDLEIFGCKVNMAGFEFVRISDEDPNNAAVAGNTDGAFALWNIQVFLDEETDMEQLQKDLTGAYGQGVGGEYSYIDWSTGKPYEVSSQANMLLSNYAKGAAKDSMFYGVMDDPAYREQMWVCTDAGVISDTTRARIAQLVGQNGHSEEEIQGWLNEFPWITLRFTNTTHWGILKEAGELDVEFAEYMTNNYLEYRAMAYVVTAQRAAMDAAE